MGVNLADLGLTAEITEEEQAYIDRLMEAFGSPDAQAEVVAIAQAMRREFEYALLFENAKRGQYTH